MHIKTGVPMYIIVILILLSTAAPAASAQDTMHGSFHVDIPALPLGEALKSLADQGDFQIVFTADAVKNRLAPHIAGLMRPEQALETLLAGTELEFVRVGDAYVIRPHKSAAATQTDPTGAGGASTAAGSSGPASTPSSQLIRVAQSNSSDHSDTGSRAAQFDQQPVKDSGEQKLEEIVVTAQKRAERLIDVPISIVALNSDDLQERQITRIDDLTSAVPGLAIQDSGTSRRILLRGVSNLFGGSPLIGLYLDEADVTGGPYTQLDLSTYDLQRVEVLRGPQGTLYGEGSAGGTIRFITNNPVLDQFAMNADVASMFTQDGAPSQRIQEVLNVPLVQNELGLRIAGTFDHEGGWIDQPAANRTNFNDENLAEVRVKGLWQPMPQFTATATATVHRNDQATNSGADANDDFTQAFNLTTTPNMKDDYDIYNVTLTYDVDPVRILSTTSYIDSDQQILNSAASYQITPPGTPRYEFYNPLDRRTSSIFAEELRLASVGSGPWQWTVGGFYRHAEFNESEPQEYFGLPGPPGTPLPSPYSSQSANLFDSWAAFGDTSFKLTDRLTLGAGLRYFEDNQKFASGSYGDLGPNQTRTFHSLDPRAYVEIKLTDHVNAYASAARGFRSGGFNALNQPAYGPETVWTYELGTKMSAVDGRLSTDLAVFYSNYTDYQIVGVVLNPPEDITSNAGKARVKGVEWGFDWRPAEQWKLSFNGDYIDSEFVEINATSTAYTVGDPLDGFPKYEYTVSAEHDFKWNGRGGFVRLDYIQTGRETYRNRNIDGPTPWYFSESDVIDMLNFNTSLQWSDSLSLSLFAQNLLNNQGFTAPWSIEETAPRARPRTVGIGFGVKFH